jgi:WD40 repeat protein
MKLELSAVLGQGGFTAVAALPKPRPRVAAAAGDRLLLLEADREGTRVRHAVAGGAALDALALHPAAASRKPDEPVLVSGSRRGALSLWCVPADGPPRRLLDRPLGAPIRDVAWGPGGTDEATGPIAAALGNGTVALYLPGSDELRLLGEPGEPELSVDWFPDGEHLAAAGEDGVLRIWEWRTGRQAEGGLLQHHNAIGRVRVSRCGRYVAFASEDERGSVFDLARRTHAAFGLPADPVQRLAWHPHEPRLAAGTLGGRTLIHDVAAADTVMAGVHLHPVEDVAWSPDGRRAFSVSRAGTLDLVQHTAQGWMTVRRHTPEAHGYALSLGWAGPDRLAVGSSRGAVDLWTAVKGRWDHAELPKGHTQPVYGLDVSRDGRAVASGSVDHHVKIWDVASKLQAHDLGEVHKQPVYGVSWSPDGRHVATGSGDTYLVVYDVEAMKKKAAEEFGKDEYWHFAVRNKVLNCVAWRPTGGTIAVGLSNHTVVLLPVDRDGRVTKGPTLRAHEDAVSEVAWTRDGRRLVSVGYDRRIVVWDPETGRPVTQRTAAHTEPIQALAVHPGDRLLATGSWDGTIGLWHIDDLRPLHVEAEPPFSAVEDLDFDADGGRLASASSDGTVCVWRVLPG